MKIETRALTKRYGGTRALDRVSLEIQPGQIVSLLGPNGAGKSTLLRCLAGIVGPDSGQVYYDDELQAVQAEPSRLLQQFPPSKNPSAR